MEDKQETQKVWLEFFIGLPASGKTTFYNTTYKADPSVVRVSRDDFRNMRGTYWLPKDEDMISDWEVVTAGIALMKGKNVVIDATNLNPARRGSFLSKVDRFIQASGNDIAIEVRHREFNVPVNECIKRDAQRPNPVGKRVIVHMAMSAGLYKHQYAEYRKQEAGLPLVIICDIDGTLALNRSGRDVYATDATVMEDDVNIPVARILINYTKLGYRPIILSGRSELSRGFTEKWLEDNGIPRIALHMRKAGDNRSDEIVKREMFEQYIDGRYNVEFVLDDRDKVVKMWREELNLPVFQVNYGDF